MLFLVTIFVGLSDANFNFQDVNKDISKDPPIRQCSPSRFMLMKLELDRPVTQVPLTSKTTFYF